MSELRLNLETPLPDSLPASRGTAVFLFGTSFHPRRRVRRLELLVDGEPHPVTAARMPRFDRYAALHPKLGTGRPTLPATDPSSPEDPEIRSYRSGFWGTAPVPAAEAGRSISIGLRARLDDGTHAEASAGEIPIGEPPPGAVDEAETIGVCMSTYNPDLVLFRAQVESLREQTDEDWICLVSDDCSRPELYAEIEAVLAGDPRFVLSRSERRLGFYRGFERALGMLPPRASLVALCDQDDRWYPEKLATLRSEIGEAQLVYSDQRLVDPAGDLLAESYWGERANNHTNLTSLLIANTITGAAALMRREVVECALPFPAVPGDQYHDHWLGLVALATGEVAYVPRPLYDYVQHDGAALGHEAANAGLTGPPAMSWRDRLRLGSLRRLVADGRGAYFFGYERLAVLARVLVARGGTAMPRAKRRTLLRFAHAESRPVRGVGWLALRRLRRLWGRNETLGVERLLVQGILWRHALAVRATGVERPQGWTYDASMPPIGAHASASPHREPETEHIQRIISPLGLSLSEREPERLNLLIPTIDLKHLFGGYIAKFNLARRLAERGRRVRIVAIDPTPPLPSDWRARVESYRGLAGTFGLVEVAFAREADRPLPVNPRDTFVATTWWTAHVAAAAVAETDRERFLYVIQEYEPFTFEMGSLAALAMQSYGFPHVALFSTELLRDFFARHGHGVFAEGEGEGRRRSASFENAITPVVPPAVEELAGREGRRLLFYARAEQHARRNMFELGLIALTEACERGVFGPEWEFAGVGSVEGRSTIGLPGGRSLEILNRLPQAEYGAMLSRHDVGLSLMFTPHPSLVPLEMASAGLLTVTNSFENKGPSELGRISSNLIIAEPTINGVVGGLAEAVERASSHEARVAGAAVNWSRDWDISFGEGVLAQVDELLEAC